MAWLTRRQVSPDPTPINPLGLKLALQHPDTAAVYLARPCQFGSNRNCKKRFWAAARFSPEVINAFSQALDQLKHRFANEQFQLIGYSGGGAIAALVAAKRMDVVRLVTVAGNLDHTAWTELHHVSPLKDSLNPADFHNQLQHISELHFVGGQDKIVPLSVVSSYVDRFPLDARPRVKLVKNATHKSLWEPLWRELYLINTGNPK
jgi:pimeloyl-ACP methyl ester carboxylesterase